VRRLRLEGVVARSLQAHALVRPAASITAAIRAAAGVYGTAPSSHLGLAARLESYAPADLEHERLEVRSVLRVPGMRGSVFLAPRELAPAFLALSRSRTVRQTLTSAGVTTAVLERLMGRIDEVLADERLAARGIRERLGGDDPGGPVMTLVLRAMAHEGRVVAAEPVGGARATSYRYARMADWAPELTEVPDSASALGVAARLWMRANGPGSVADLAWWAGVPRVEARAALVATGAREIAIVGLSEPQWSTDEIVDAADAAGPEGVVHLLPAWDTWLMSRRERSRCLDDSVRPFVVDRNGNVTNTVTLDGRVVGTWDSGDERLRVWLAEPLASGPIEAAAARLQPFAAWRAIEHVDAPRPLDEGGQNAFRSPLRTLAPHS
jgi:hypothetical protein